MRLPWVVAPCPGEWLGFWLHRVAQPYGLEVAAILHQAGISFDKGPMPTWGRLGNLGKADLHLLALALGERPARLHALQRRISQNGPPSQVGYCRACLLESRRPGCPRHWRRDWLDPYIGWCGKHRHGLMTLDAREVRPLRTSRDTASLLASLVDDCVVAPARVSVNDVGAALQLQTALRGEATRAGRCESRPLRRVVDSIAVHAARHAADLLPPRDQSAPVAPIAWVPAPFGAGAFAAMP